MPAGYEEVPHTADLALQVWGGSLDELFATAAQGMFGLMGKPDSGNCRHRVQLQSMDRESLLVDWLNELLYMHEKYGELYSNFTVVINNNWSLSGEVIGSTGAVTGVIIKAATYSGLQIKYQDGIYSAVIVFDT